MVVHNGPERVAQQHNGAVAVQAVQNLAHDMQEFEENLHARLDNLRGLMVSGLMRRETAILRIIAIVFVILLGAWIPLLCLGMCGQFVLLLVMTKIDAEWLGAFLVLNTVVTLKTVYTATFLYWCNQVYTEKEVCLRRLVHENRYAKQVLSLSWLQSQLLFSATVCKFYEWIWPFVFFECVAFCVFTALFDVYRQRNEFWRQFPYITVRDVGVTRIAEAAVEEEEDDDTDSETDAEAV